MNAIELKAEYGKVTNLPFASDLGGYVVEYIIDDGDTLCGLCAADPLNPVEFANEDSCPDDWNIIGSQLLEGSREFEHDAVCSGCNLDLWGDDDDDDTAKCNQCDSSTINGVFCHEYGCPIPFVTLD